MKYPTLLPKSCSTSPPPLNLSYPSPVSLHRIAQYLKVTVSSEGSIVSVIEHDDGSGWVKVSDGSDDGLVPASYLEHGTGESSNDQGSGQYGASHSLCRFSMKRISIEFRSIVKALYVYEAQGSDELGLKEGDMIELTSGPSGGQYYGEGWWEGKLKVWSLQFPVNACCPCAH